MARTKDTIQAPAILPALLPERVAQIEAAQDAAPQLQNEVELLATQLGYEGHLTVGTLEDEIRFFQRRTVEAILETGKRLLLLKKLTPHGEFEQRVEMLGFADRTARRFMACAQKISKSAKLAGLSMQAKNGSAFLELITHDDDVIDNLAEMDNFDRMSASQVREAARELVAEKEATDKLLENKNKQIDKLSRHIAKATPDDVLLELQKESTALMNDALGCVRGQIRQAFIAIKNHTEDDHSLFMAGLLGQLQADIAALREEFNLPDISNARDQELAAEIAQWNKQG
jgi:hypothetical protein